MASLQSNIGASLNRKRKLSRIKKFGAYFVFILFFLSLANLGLTNQKVRINNIEISGNSTVLTDKIMEIVENSLNVKYLWIIPTDNIILLRRSEIKNHILNNFKKINSVDISIHGINKIEITVTEREVKYLWCKGTPISQKDCYFMDTEGFVFERAPVFSEDAFTEYFGLILDENPIGQTYLINKFKDITGLFSAFEKMSFQPINFNTVNEHEYEIYIVGGGRILINDKKSFESSLTNLQALVDNKYIKNDVESLKKIKYIDLRFGNKVNFELK